MPENEEGRKETRPSPATLVWSLYDVHSGKGVNRICHIFWIVRYLRDKGVSVGRPPRGSGGKIRKKCNR